MSRFFLMLLCLLAAGSTTARAGDAPQPPIERPDCKIEAIKNCKDWATCEGETFAKDKYPNTDNELSREFRVVPIVDQLTVETYAIDMSGWSPRAVNFNRMGPESQVAITFWDNNSKKATNSVAFHYIIKGCLSTPAK